MFKIVKTIRRLDNKPSIQYMVGFTQSSLDYYYPDSSMLMVFNTYNQAMQLCEVFNSFKEDGVLQYHVVKIREKE